jgi:anti-sigma factor RsiW
MSCSPFDLKDYFFGELPAQDRHTVEQHLAACTSCGEELDSLNLTRNALLMVREEEPPRRIAFVSDKVFEPTWWQSLWSSGPKAGFASAALLAGAILIHGVEINRPLPEAPVALVQQQPSVTETEVAKRVEAAVRKAVSESEARQAAKLEQVVTQQKKMEFDYKADMLQAAESYRLLMRSMPSAYRASAETGVGQ